MVPEYRDPVIRKFQALNGSEVEGLVYQIRHNEFIRAEEFVKDSWTESGKADISTATNEYVDGFDPFANLKGKLAETACAILFRMPVMLFRREFGDGSADLIFADGKKLDVKTKTNWYGALSNHFLFITHHDATGYHNKVGSDYYISTLTTRFSLEAKLAEILILGYQTGEAIRQLPIKPSRNKKASHYNHEWCATDVRPMIELFEKYLCPLTST